MQGECYCDANCTCKQQVCKENVKQYK
jgi:hypothetical protein